MVTRHRANAEGDWYVGTNCIDCTAARTVAPGLIVAKGGQSVFARQPRTPAELKMAWRARVLCPTASVRTESKLDMPPGLFPEKMTEGIYRLGYNARSSSGAHSFLIRRTENDGRGGNAMVDSPRWTKAVVDKIAQWGGLCDILLTHRDDVADAARYAKHFGAKVWVHEWDRAAAPFAGCLLKGRAPAAITDDLTAIPVPGHTKGSVMFLYAGRFLFTGDSLAWSFEAGDLIAWREFCWWSWPEQTRSLMRLLDYDFEWVFAGHGGSKHLPAAAMKARLKALTARMPTERMKTE